MRTVQLASGLAPVERRDQWRAEWEAELVHHFQGGRATIRPVEWLSLEFGILRDALGLCIGGGDEWQRDLRDGLYVLRQDPVATLGAIAIPTLVVCPLILLFLL